METGNSTESAFFPRNRESSLDKMSSEEKEFNKFGNQFLQKTTVGF